MNDSLLRLLALELSGDWVPIIAISGGVLIALVGILVAHQQKMAKLFHGRREDAKLAERMHALEAHVADLDDRVNQQTLALDDVRSHVRD